MHLLQVSFVLILSVEVLSAAVESATDFNVLVATGNVTMQRLFAGGQYFAL
jgi:diacylglycerol kinase